MLTARSDPLSLALTLGPSVGRGEQSSLEREALVLAGASREELRQLEGLSYRGGSGMSGFVQEAAPSSEGQALRAVAVPLSSVTEQAVLAGQASSMPGFQVPGLPDRIGQVPGPPPPKQVDFNPQAVSTRNVPGVQAPGLPDCLGQVPGSLTARYADSVTGIPGGQAHGVQGIGYVSGGPMQAASELRPSMSLPVGLPDPFVQASGPIQALQAPGSVLQSACPIPPPATGMSSSDPYGSGLKGQPRTEGL